VPNESKVNLKQNNGLSSFTLENILLHQLDNWYSSQECS